MEEVRSMHDRHDKYIQKFSSGAIHKGNDLRGLGLERKKVIKHISKKMDKEWVGFSSELG
jgi:hypothetical protein